MASDSTIIRKRNQVMTLLLSMKKVSPDYPAGPNHKTRRRMIQNLSRAIGVPYSVSRETIKAEEAKMRAKGIDPHAPDALEQLKKLEDKKV